VVGYHLCIKADTPDQTGKAVGDKEHLRRNQAHALQGAGSLGKLKNQLRTDVRPGFPVAQVEPVEVAFARGVPIRACKVGHVRLDLHDSGCILSAPVLGKVEQQHRLDRQWPNDRRDVPKLTAIEDGDQQGVVRTHDQVHEEELGRERRDRREFRLTQMASLSWDRRLKRVQETADDVIYPDKVCLGWILPCCNGDGIFLSYLHENPYTLDARALKRQQSPPRDLKAQLISQFPI
jgi:hypothetical protein